MHLLTLSLFKLVEVDFALYKFDMCGGKADWAGIVLINVRVIWVKNNFM